MLQLIRKCQVLSLLLSFSLIYRFVNMYLLYLPILLVICNPLCSYLVFVYWMVSYIWSYKLLFNPVNRYNRDYLGSLHSGNESARNINYIFVFYTSQTSSFTLTKASILVSPWKSPKGQFFFFFFFFFLIFFWGPADDQWLIITVENFSKNFPPSHHARTKCFPIPLEPL